MHDSIVQIRRPWSRYGENFAGGENEAEAGVRRAGRVRSGIRDLGECRLFFEDFTPSEVTISYESGDQTVQQTFSPTYSRSRPNGEDCPPECVNATVVLELP